MSENSESMSVCVKLKTLNLNFSLNKSKQMTYYYIVYKTTNIINNKIYVGAHEQIDLNFDGYFGSGDIILNAIKKHGKENFKREYLEFCKNWDEALEREKFWIAELKSNIRRYPNGNGMNLNDGGWGGKNKRNNSTGMTGKHHNEESKLKISKATSGKNNPMYGKTHDDKAREKISKARLGKPAPNSSNYIYILENGENYWLKFNISERRSISKMFSTKKTNIIIFKNNIIMRFDKNITLDKINEEKEKILKLFKKELSHKKIKKSLKKFYKNETLEHKKQRADKNKEVHTEESNLKISVKLKDFIAKLSNEEKNDRLENSLRKCDHEKRGRSISRGKRGKSTNQQEIMGEKYATMTDDEFKIFLESKNKRCHNRMINLRNKFLKD